MSLRAAILALISATFLLTTEAAENSSPAMSKPDALVRSLQTWIKEGGDLNKALRAVTDQSIATKAEAEAVCSALDVVRARLDPKSDQSFRSPLHTLTGLFQQATGDAALAVLRKDGLPRLRPWVRDFIAGEFSDKNTAMFIMKILAMYGELDDIELIAQAVRLPAYTDAFMWSVVLKQFDAEHPHASKMVDALRDPMPSGFALVSYLDMANALAIAGKLGRHPFDSEEGRVHLERWLRDASEEHFSYAVSATAALPFIQQSSRKVLFAIAANHPDAAVRMESAWAQAKSGDPAGFERLATLCLDPSQSYTAQQYLEELGQKSKIPKQAQDPDFRAVAEMANWLSHPSEFGRPPAKIELLDSRTLLWPPSNERKHVWLVKYTYTDTENGIPDIGVGMVGSVTFALFGETTADLSPEDIYSLHCCWELEMNKDPRAPEERSVEAGRKLLRLQNKGF